MGWYGDWYPKPTKRRPANGLKARTGPGQKFGQTWWAGKWLRALEQLVDPGRLSRGRSYARSGQVLNLDIKAGQVASRVQGSRPSPYQIKIQLKPLNDKQWAQVADAMSAQALFAAKLLAGEMPPNIEEAFAAAGVSLFPAKPGELITDCSCPDYANPCKHVAAVYYLLGERFDDDPFLLFELRGRTRAQIIDALRARRAVAPTAPTGRPSRKKSKGSAAAAPALAPEQAPPLSASLAHFWEPASQLDTLSIPIAAPELEAALVRRRGEPAFWTANPPFITRLSETYRATTAAALDLALAD